MLVPLDMPWKCARSLVEGFLPQPCSEVENQASNVVNLELSTLLTLLSFFGLFVHNSYLSMSAQTQTNCWTSVLQLVESLYWILRLCLLVLGFEILGPPLQPRLHLSSYPIFSLAAPKACSPASGILNKLCPSLPLILSLVCLRLR